MSIEQNNMCVKESVINEVHSSEFNCSITVTELLTKTLENVARELASRCITECASRHGFDAKEEIRLLGLENLALIKRQMAKKPKTEKQSKQKTPKEPKTKTEKKTQFPLPFIADGVDLMLCNGLAYNSGLFTQCPKKTMVDSLYCKGCQAQADNSASGKPKCGTVQDRLAVELYQFKDSTGRSPVSYLKVLEKAKKTQNEAIQEAEKQGLEIDAEHLTVQVKVKKASSRGRPKKAVGSVVASDVTDLFAKLTAEGDEEIVLESEHPPVKAKKGSLTEEEKAIKKAALEADRAAKKAEKDAQLAIEKAEKEAKRLQEKAVKDAKIAAEKAEREAKRLQEKAEREAKKAAEKAEKESKKAAKKSVVAVVEPVAVAVAVPVVQAPSSEEGVAVKKIKINGVIYLKSKDNMLYNMESEEVGIWDDAAKKILPLPKQEEEEEVEEDEEEELEEYEDTN